MSADNETTEKILRSVPLTEIAEQMGEATVKATEMGRKVVTKFDDARQSAADMLDKAAASVASKGDRAADVALSAAAKIQDTADYVRNTDIKKIGGRVEDLVRRHPGWSVAAAIMVGIAIGRSFTRA